MAYRDPSTGRDRNLVQDDTAVGSWIVGIIVVALIALGAYYYYGAAPRTADLNKEQPSTALTTTPASPTNSPASEPSSTGSSSGTSGSSASSPAENPNPPAENANPAPNNSNPPPSGTTP